MKTTLTSLNNTIPLAHIGPQWPGVNVLLTQTGFTGAVPFSASFGFNLGTHVGDELSQVETRRHALENYLGAPIVWLNQVHGCDVVHVTEAGSTPNADASCSTRSSVALAIMTADCLPVLFAAFNSAGKAVGVAAAHAGWRGLHGGVLQASVNALTQACALPPANIKAWMGPAIGPQSFEVGQEVQDAFLQQNPANAACFLPGASPTKYLADIYELARIALSGAGVRSVEGGGLDTLTDSRWFSHRRGQLHGLPSGRFATLIRLLPEHGV